MNAPLSYSPDEEQLLDRLVDGELTEPERRELLLRLESEGDGWRRCALAFLEAQAWGREFRQVARDPANWDRAKPAEKPVLARSPLFGSRWGAGLAMAASFLLAFSLGLLWRDWDAGRGAMRGGVAGNDNPRRRGSPGELAVAPAPRVGVDNSNLPTWETVYLPLDENQDGVPEPIELPVVYGPGVDERWLANQSGGLPAGFLEAMQRRGHKVRQNREFVPVQLEDGRQAIVPVDQVEVQFAQHRTFQ